MLRPWSRNAAVAPDEGGLATLDHIDVDDLEVLELDDDGRWVGPLEERPRASIPELGYSMARDGTGVAPIWQLIAER